MNIFGTNEGFANPGIRETETRKGALGAFQQNEEMGPYSRGAPVLSPTGTGTTPDQQLANVLSIDWYPGMNSNESMLLGLYYKDWLAQKVANNTNVPNSSMYPGNVQDVRVTV